MAKYDQGGGCSCGLYKTCNCEHATVPVVPRKIDISQLGRVVPARVKITDEMVEAAIKVYLDEAAAAGEAPPPEDTHPEQWAAMRVVTRKALKAARDAVTTITITEY